MVTKQKTVGIRVPDNPISIALVEELGNPIVTTSAILEPDQPLFSEPYEFEEHLGNRVDLIIDGGRVYPDPSTVIALISDQPEILREGKGDVGPFL